MGKRRPSAAARGVAVLCFVVGVPLCGVALACLFADYEQGSLNSGTLSASIVILSLGSALCWAGKWLGRNR